MTSSTRLCLDLAKKVGEHPGTTLIIVPDTLTAERFEREIRFFLGDASEARLLAFPDRETLPYDRFSPHQDIVSDRLKTLYRLAQGTPGALIVPVSTLMHRLCPESYVVNHGLLLHTGQHVSLLGMRKRLQQAGYGVVDQVTHHGEFSVRGSLLDVYPMGSEWPVRVDFFDDEVDSIRFFDPETQRSQEKVESLQVLPASECAMTEQAIVQFRTAWRTCFEGDPSQSSVYTEISERRSSPGIEYFLPLFFEDTASLMDYLPSDAQVIRIGAVEEAAKTFWAEVLARYDQYGHDRTYPLLAPQALFFSVPEFFSQIKPFQPQVITEWTQQSQLPDLKVEARHEHPIEKLQRFLSEFKGKVLFCCETPGRREVLKELLNRHRIFPVDFSDWQTAAEDTRDYGLLLAPFEEGTLFEDLHWALITEAELFGRRAQQQRRRQKQRVVEQDAIIRDLAELSIGMPVVHLEHGVGRYLGLSQVTVASQEGEYLTLEYSGGDKLYVPVASIHLISRYGGVNSETVALNRLGTEQWKKARQAALEQARDTAAELLHVYANREAKQGVGFTLEPKEYQLFVDEFPFEETMDQQLAIEQVIRDLTSARPMDRVICGDVGFGKTEVALRAAFVAVQAGKQVAVLAPTTLLVEQHAQTFSDRFAAFPVKIESLSRFRSKTEQQRILNALKAGQVDIVIGTHKLLQKDMVYRDLGLVIIDEEHRFGVRQKEVFKGLRAEVNMLTLTATPIPRTLNMAMGGIRDLSIIATPPLKRLSIKTFVREYQVPLIQEAIARELHRGGQVYYLHNNVDTIARRAEELSAWLPTARVEIAHGQMHERDLERIMSDFYHRRFNVLVCTTIIETGIDIPTANTILMERADKLGLAQLHQLRGRVGRSHHQAYAYCLTPAKSLITADAAKRLGALQASETLGSGFSLATQDLEIRGAGELLGDEQSGNIQTVGFSLYMELLEQAVRALKAGKILTAEDALKRGIEVNLQLPAFIPETFVSDVHTRLVLYKRIAGVKTRGQTNALQEEIQDRFGVLPEQVKNLFAITEIRYQAEPLGIVRIEAHAKGGWLEFGSQPLIDPLKIVALIQKHPKQYQFSGAQKLKFMADWTKGEERIAGIEKILNYFR